MKTEQEESIFTAALSLASPAEKQAFLAEACADDPALLARVQALLRAHDNPDSYLESPQVTLAATLEQPTIQEGPGTVIGPYKLLEQIGEGGFGMVFMAEQQEPVRRKVALKILKPGMDTRQVVARFEAERQALALMDHPHIAHVFDGGQTATGRPYFVMELVRGIPITAYCEQHGLGLRERLRLFVDVCQAVQHAHQKGIIHRDLKPSNVLVTQHDSRPVVKVIDFGIAKATGQSLTDKTLFTQFAQWMGTPLYMSPEQTQWSGLDVDTRSDVYSLGVLLYELLTGTTPFDVERLKTLAYDEIRRVIREEEPPRPSTRLSTLAQAGSTVSARPSRDPRRLSQAVRGELDWIVMKALEKDRGRRYDSANSFGLDVERYLADEPVHACPPSARYRLRKFVRRHRGQVLAAVAILVLLLAGTAVSTWQALRATHAEKQTSEALAQATAAQTETRDALDTLTDNVVTTMFTKQQALDKTERDFLHKVLAFYEGFATQSGETADARFLRAKGFYTVAFVRALLGEHRGAVAGYRQAEALLEQLAAESPETADYRHKLARTEHGLGIELAKSGILADAETAFRRGIALRSQLADAFPNEQPYRLELAKVYHDFGVFRGLQHRDAEAEENYRHAVDLQEKLAAEAPEQPRYRFELSTSLNALGDVLRKEGKYADAEKFLRRALRIQQEQMTKGPATGKDRGWLARSYSGLGIVLAELNKNRQAEDAFRQALEIRRKLTEDFPGVLEYREELANNTANLGYFLKRLGKYAEAEEPYRRALELRKAIVAQAGPVRSYRQDVAGNYVDLAYILRLTHRPRESETASRHAQEMWKQLLLENPKDPDYRAGLAMTLTNQALLHNERREFAAAALLLEQAQPNFKAALAARPNDPDFRAPYRDYLEVQVECCLGQHDHAQAAASAAELATFGHEPAKDRYAAAKYLCRCSALANNDSRLDESARRELAGKYADHAIALLQEAVQHGFHDVGQVNNDPDFKPLQTRESFKKLLAELRSKGKK